MQTLPDVYYTIARKSNKTFEKENQYLIICVMPYLAIHYIILFKETDAFSVFHLLILVWLSLLLQAVTKWKAIH